MAKELTLAAVLGMSTAVVVLLPVVVEGQWWRLSLPAFVGAVVGVLVGYAAVCGGWYALRTARVWPPAGPMWWRHRFAACSAAAVLLAVGGALVVLVMAGSNEVSFDRSGSATVLAAVLMVAAVSYGCSWVFAPDAPRFDIGSDRSRR